MDFIVDVITTGWPEEVVEKVIGIVEAVAGNRDVGKFCIDCGLDLSQAKLRHEADTIIVLYKTDNIDNAKLVQEVLVRLFLDSPKCSNRSDVETGETSEGGTNYIYVAVWYN